MRFERPRCRRGAAPAAALAAAVTLGAAAAAAAAPAETAPYRRHLEHQGVAVDLEIEPLADGAALQEGEPVAVRFRITDTNTGRPFSALAPAAWLDRLAGAAEAQPDTCRQKVESFVGGSLLAQPEQDLNVYYVLALNDEATISVVDPLFGFGSSKLLAMVFLAAPGHDWAMTADQRLLFVSMPEVDRVAVVSTAEWSVQKEIDVGPDPGRLALAPDDSSLWVAYGEPLPGTEDGRTGVTAIDVATLSRVADVATGRGDHDLAFDDRGRLFVTNRGDGTVTALDAGRREVLATLATAADPVSIAVSATARAAYVSHRASGVVTAVDTERLEVVARVEAEPGLDEVRFAPGGRLALLVNPDRDLLHVLDAAAGRIVQTADMEDGPDHVAFSDELAYVRHRGSETVLMVPLDEIGREGQLVPVIDFPGGQRPAGGGEAATPAAGIVQAPGASAVLVANPADRAIYYYKEGMAAPMGHFVNYGRRPRAVLVVDRSLREVEPGTYRTEVILRRAGDYDLAFLLDVPRVVHCFDLTIAENPRLAAERRARRPVEVRYRPAARKVTVGEEVRLPFELFDRTAGTARGGRDDVEVLTFLAPGIWQERHRAEPAADGRYEVRFAPPRPGVYYVFVRAPGLGLDFRESPFVTLTVTAEEEPTR
ncbi:MAG TPA: hypothetical protein VF100_03970 [Thermoanaerobaculia bacterium]